MATNCHVIDRRDDIIVYKSHNRRADTDTAFPATILHSNEDKDFCLLNVNRLAGIPTAIRRYNTLKVGETTYALGAPDGYDLSLSDGLISQLREWDGNQFIQTNAAISPGSSGGGLFDSEGNLIGITTEKIADVEVEGIGFAIPADLVLEY
ncbi:S1C family serine protease [Candidatus Spongiihabitans sp.]|uniref:S1C family serine protease n=1 Tax=Candidatus Spongiihabitans sp. TaxID=3101308 RepID=UPI003C7C1956